MKKGLFVTTWHVIPVKAEKCTACRRKDCPDYACHKSPELKYDKCHRYFFGTDCYWHYKKSSDKDKKTMRDIFTKCTECCKIIEHPRKKKNKGGKNTNELSLNFPYAKKT